VLDIRHLIYGLRPPVLDDLGLNGAMEELIERVRQQPGAPHVTLHLPTMPTLLPAAVEVAVYRIFQEAIHDVVQHAQASICEVRLEVQAGGKGRAVGQGARLMLEVLDNGTGIAAARLSGVGLQSMRERSEELGGHLVIEQGADGGTRLRAVLPIPNARRIDDHFHADC
jgi:signal transduction histidine kinase